MKKRTVREFKMPYNEFWQIFNKYASISNLYLKEETGYSKLYQKKDRMWSFQLKIKVINKGDKFKLEFWIPVGSILTLFLLPSEMSLESGGLKAIIGRNIARESINHLLSDLGQQLIK